MRQDSKITIIDVARRAGVSKGTVDRVLHNRGEVSPASAEKVRKAIEELHYEPNLHASLLALRHDRTIVLLLPRFEKGEYWEKIHDGFVRGGEDVANMGIRTEVFLYDQYSPESFREACGKVLGIHPDGVVLPPLFHMETIDFVGRLNEDGVPYAYVDSKVEDDNYLAYFGMPMYKSGHLCAFLMTDRCAPSEVDEIAVIRIMRDKNRQSDPTVSRRAGFVDYISAKFHSCRIYNVFIDPSDSRAVDETLDKFFSEHPGIRYVVMFNSRIHLLGRYLVSHPMPGRRVIGFDDLEKNLDMLKAGLVDVLISHHSETQSRLAVAALADFIILHKAPVRRDNYLHMDILTRFNEENY